ncbi:hypothetical protein GpartN1_g5874.t1 [Galdieria partita]|uniref:Archaeal ATPase n=1 Tax=Galdieria partita TaxID=83374 RepID=A0A9C7PTK2_9RHOD|nr:hypothetical protein GpartN1_g1407.t1 [Galdieria partita]GJQ14083.1 hypothetical protein GpartN1_g5874.t1 [Galdieria partita]
MSLGEKWGVLRDTFEPIVVDREDDVYHVTDTLCELYRNRRQLRVETTGLNYRLSVPFAPHLFGSGKTTFCRSYLELVQRFHETSLSSFASDASRKEFLDKLREAVLLYVDMRHLEPTDPKEKSLKWAVYYLIIKTACLQVGIPMMRKTQAYETVEMEALNLVTLLRDILNMRTDQFLLVAFDEVGVLDTRGQYFDLEVNDGRIRPYNDFFGILWELCLEDNVFFIVVGKSKGLSIKNYVASVSKVLLHFISLSPLNSSSIVEFLEKSHLKVQTQSRVCDILCNPSFSVNELAEALLEYTGGVPGLLTRAVNMLLNYVQTRGQSFGSKDECLSCMKEDGFRTVCSDPFVTRISTLDEDTRSLLDMLLMMALYRIPFNVNDRLNSGSYLFDAVTEMGLYRHPIDMNTFQVLFPKVFIGIFEELTSLSLLERILLGSLNIEPVDCFFASKCRVFEGIVALRLVWILSSKVRNEFRELLGRLSAIWKDMKLPINGPSPLHYMMSVSRGEARSESSKERKTYASNEWNEIIHGALGFDKVYIPKEANSYSPDIMFKLQSPVKFKFLMVGVACKGRWKSEGIGWSDVIEEAKKFLKPVYDQVLSQALEFYHCMLIIVSTKLALNVANELGNQSRCYTSGMRIGGNSFEIPPNCELVILCESDVEMLIDREILNGLERAFSTSDRPVLKNFGLGLVQRVRHSFLSWQ